jgi:hypothetical protein
MKRFFITKENTVRWIHTFIREDISWDNGKTHLVFSMKNNLNSPDRPSDGLVESVDVGDCYETLEMAQMAILVRERFNKN